MRDYTQYRKGIAKATNKELKGEKTYDEAMIIVRDFIKNRQLDKQFDKDVVKDKKYLKDRRQKYKELVKECVLSKNLKIEDYDNTEAFIKEAVADLVGYGPLDDAFNDDRVSDIFVIAWDLIYVEKDGKNVKYEKIFRSKEHWRKTLLRFLQEAGEEINNGDRKIVNFELYGDRGAATASAISPRDYSCTFRKHGQTHVTEQDMVNSGVLTPEMSELIGLFLNGELNIIYAGLTGSGKTTSVKALINKHITDKRILVAEDTQELFLENEHTLDLVSFDGDNEKTTVSLNDIILLALRLKPRTIVVGEVRGKEAQAAVEAMETGHSTIFTMHGGKPLNIINRLVTKYLTAMPSLGIDVVERIIGSAVDYICIQDNIPGIGRKITVISEVGYDFKTGRVTLKPIFKFNFEKKSFEWVNPISEDKAHTMLRRGIKYEQIEKWIKGPPSS